MSLHGRPLGGCALSGKPVGMGFALQFLLAVGWARSWTNRTGTSKSSIVGLGSFKD
jgi:hypothetical protein